MTSPRERCLPAVPPRRGSTTGRRMHASTVGPVAHSPRDCDPEARLVACFDAASRLLAGVDMILAEWSGPGAPLPRHQWAILIRSDDRTMTNQVAMAVAEGLAECEPTVFNGGVAGVRCHGLGWAVMCMQWPSTTVPSSLRVIRSVGISNRVGDEP